MEPKNRVADDQPDPPDGTSSGESPAAAAATGKAPPEVPDPAAEIAALNDRLLRALAEGENLRRRAQREREETAKFAISNFARDMLVVADNLQRALAALEDVRGSVPDALKPFVEGVELTERQFQSTLERHGIRAINALGQKSDHNLHETLFEVPTDEAPPGTVVQVVEVGYTLNDRLLRAARVGIAKAAPKDGGEASRHVDTKV